MEHASDGHQAEIIRLGGLDIILRVLEFHESFESDSSNNTIYQQAMGALAALAANRIS